MPQTRCCIATYAHAHITRTQKHTHRDNLDVLLVGILTHVNVLIGADLDVRDEQISDHRLNRGNVLSGARRQRQHAEVRSGSRDLNEKQNTT